MLFPVGGYTKPEIRSMAREHGLPVHDKPDSQEICFVPDDDYLSFVRGRRPERQTGGPILDEDGRVLGEHTGIEGFTIGQRRGLGLAVGSPRYVIQIEPSRRTVTVGPKESLEKLGLIAARFNWQSLTPTGPIPCLAQIRRSTERYLRSLNPCRASAPALSLRYASLRLRPVKLSRFTRMTLSWAAAGSRALSMPMRARTVKRSNHHKGFQNRRFRHTSR